MISACSNRFANRVEPLVYSNPDGPEALFLFDGCGSWGTGAETAAWFREHIADMIREPAVCRPSTITETLTTLIRSLPKELTEDHWGWQFALAALIIRHKEVHVGVTGNFSTLAVRAQTVERLVTPIRLIDELISHGSIPASEAQTHRYRHIICSPLFGMEGEAQLNWAEPSELAIGDRIILGDAALPRFLEERVVSGDPWDFDKWDVEQLRDHVEGFGGGNSPTGVVTIGA